MDIKGYYTQYGWYCISNGVLYASPEDAIDCITIDAEDNSDSSVAGQ